MAVGFGGDVAYMDEGGIENQLIEINRIVGEDGAECFDETLPWSMTVA